METVIDKINLEQYLEYKDSEVEWLGEIPSHWEVLTVKRLGKTKAGGTPSTTNLKFWDGNIPWLPSGKLQNCEINTAEKFITESGLKNSATKLIKPNTTLIALTGATCANIGYLKFEACANQSVIAIEEYENVNSKFLYYALINERNQILLSQTGGAQAGINETDVKNIILPTPTYTEQIAIADFLDHKTALIDQAIGIKQKQIELLKERRQIIIYNAVTKGSDNKVKMKDSGVQWIGQIPEHWKIESLKNILTERNEKNAPLKTREILSLSIDKGVTLYAEKTTNLDRFKDDFSQYKLAHKDDLVFNSMNMIVGAVGVSDYFGCVSPVYYTYYGRHNYSNTKFYEYLFRCKTLQGVLYSLGKGLIAIDRGEGKYNTLRLKVSRDDLRSLRLPFPSHSEQIQIISYIETQSSKIKTLISLKEQEIEKLKEYKATLINSAVTGKIKIC